jgi:hypothetical protein
MLMNYLTNNNGWNFMSGWYIKNHEYSYLGCVNSFRTVYTNSCEPQNSLEGFQTTACDESSDCSECIIPSEDDVESDCKSIVPYSPKKYSIVPFSPSKNENNSNVFYSVNITSDDPQSENEAQSENDPQSENEYQNENEVCFDGSIKILRDYYHDNKNSNNSSKKGSKKGERSKESKEKHYREWLGCDPNVFFKEFGLMEKEFSRAILSVSYDGYEAHTKMRSLTFKFINPDCVLIIPHLYASLRLLVKNCDYLNFGFHKVLISQGILYDPERVFYLHRNIFVDNDYTPINILRKMVKVGLKTLVNPESVEDDDPGYYGLESVDEIRIKVWNMDLVENKSIKLNEADKSVYDLKTGEKIDFAKGFKEKVNSSPSLAKKVKGLTKSTKTLGKRKFHTSAQVSANASLIGKLKPIKSLSGFGTGDIETVNINDFQIPVSISACYGDQTLYFEVDRNLFHSNCEESVQQMFNEYFDMTIKQRNKIIFYHNLGRFDGRYIYERLIKYSKKEGRLDSVKCLIDTDKSFISIKYLYNDKGESITFQDSLRLFGVSLKKLCKVYNVEGKLSDYNIEFNKLDILDKPEQLSLLRLYSVQDSKCLYDALKKAQEIYFNNYSVDISKVLSTASLSKKIFRTHFMDNPIPSLNGMTDAFVREGYFGGGTDVYHLHGRDLYYYDVNSLYPYVMKKKCQLSLLKDMVHVKKWI